MELVPLPDGVADTGEAIQGLRHLALGVRVDEAEATQGTEETEGTGGCRHRDARVRPDEAGGATESGSERGSVHGNARSLVRGVQSDGGILGTTEVRKMLYLPVLLTAVI